MHAHTVLQSIAIGKQAIHLFLPTNVKNVLVQRNKHLPASPRDTSAGTLPIDRMHVAWTIQTSNEDHRTRSTVLTTRCPTPIFCVQPHPRKTFLIFFSCRSRRKRASGGRSHPGSDRSVAQRRICVWSDWDVGRRVAFWSCDIYRFRHGRDCCCRRPGPNGSAATCLLQEVCRKGTLVAFVRRSSDYSGNLIFCSCLTRAALKTELRGHRKMILIKDRQ